MYVIVCVLLADDVHGRAKFIAVFGFSRGFGVGQKCEYDLWYADDDTVRGHPCHVR